MRFVALARWGGHGQNHESGVSKTMMMKGCLESEGVYKNPASVAAKSKQPLESNPAFRRVHSYAAELPNPKHLSHKLNK